jgi:hypothetical protein
VLGSDSSLQRLIYRCVGCYLLYECRRAQARRIAEFESEAEARRRIAHTTALAVRGRTGGDLLRYVAETLFAGPIALSPLELEQLSGAFLRQTDTCRSLLLLALSAHLGHGNRETTRTPAR